MCIRDSRYDVEVSWSEGEQVVEGKHVLRLQSDRDGEGKRSLLYAVDETHEDVGAERHLHATSKFHSRSRLCRGESARAAIAAA
eukprot:962348-Prymnesium_polylepis.1